ncbi:MAG: pseudouridine synthase [Verrucomicrobiae bacterium]|nr:pseudouridine synthase [Verrucomicrobiae bacterium]
MLIAFHKPWGILTQFTPEQEGQRTLAEFGFPERVYPLGRLDRDSEGLLLLSDEAGLNSRLLDPENGHARTYHAQVEGAISGNALDRLRRGGLDLRGHRTKPCQAIAIQPDHPDRDPPIRYRAAIPTSWISLELTEGKNRQVRRMTAAVGFPTLRLIRVGIGELQMESLGLESGEWRELSTAQRALVFSGDADRSPSAPRKSASKRRSRSRHRGNRNLDRRRDS